jgi:hypothetical protein
MARSEHSLFSSFVESNPCSFHARLHCMTSSVTGKLFTIERDHLHRKRSMWFKAHRSGMSDAYAWHETATFNRAYRLALPLHNFHNSQASTLRLSILKRRASQRAQKHTVAQSLSLRYPLPTQGVLLCACGSERGKASHKPKKIYTTSILIKHHLKSNFESLTDFLRLTLTHSNTS